MSEQANINPDGSATFETPPEATTEDIPPTPTGEPQEAPGGFDENTYENGGEGPFKSAVGEGGVDPAVYFLIGVAVVAILYYFFVYRKKEADGDDDDFFSELDVEKFKLTLPDEVEEYYKVKAKCEAAGWEPGKGPPEGTNPQAAGPYRMLAQALMKRAIADIPLVTHIQKESQGMNRLYSQSMCSAKQWRAYQAAEQLVSTEVEEVRAEADEVEPGWSGAIWRQAMQYHNMLKQRHEMEAKAVEAQAAQAQAAQARNKAETTTATTAVTAAAGKNNKEMDAAEKERAAQRAAEELIQQEEREKQGKKAFSSGGSMKKGFLTSGGGKGKKK